MYFWNFEKSRKNYFLPRREFSSIKPTFRANTKHNKGINLNKLFKKKLIGQVVTIASRCDAHV
jgi:hypothetical protein